MVEIFCLNVYSCFVAQSAIFRKFTYGSVKQFPDLQFQSECKAHLSKWKGESLPPDNCASYKMILQPKKKVDKKTFQHFSKCKGNIAFSFAVFNFASLINAGIDSIQSLIELDVKLLSKRGLLLDFIVVINFILYFIVYLYNSLLSFGSPYFIFKLTIDW